MKNLKWYWWVLIVAVILFILYKLATRHRQVISHHQNADGTSTSYITTANNQMQIDYDVNGNTMRVHAKPVFVVVGGKDNLISNAPKAVK